MTAYPKISFVIPTLNASKYLTECLLSIESQNYPKESIEIIIADGGSSDDTLKIANSFGAKTFNNPLRTAESGKSVGIKNANGEYICLIDSDNLLPQNDWIVKMIEPLVANRHMLGSEPLYFSHREEDGFIDRYCALMGMNDPICYWIGSYDRMNTLSGTWTGLKVKQKDKIDYIELKLESGNIPTIGANGTVFRVSLFKDHPDLLGDYLFDMDILEVATMDGKKKEFAKVKIGIVHQYCGSSLRRFAKKQMRRVRDFLYRRTLKDVFITANYEQRKYKYGHNSTFSFGLSIVSFILSCLLIFPLIYQTALGYSRKKDIAWLAHPVLCWITLVTYAIGTFQSIFKRSEFSRHNW